MNSQKIVPLIIKYSGLTAVALLAYFLLMKLLGYAGIVELRFLNFIIMLLGVRFFILRLKHENDGRLEYLQSLGYGFIVAAIASVIFSAFMMIYLAYIDHSLLQSIQTNQRFGESITPASAALVLILEGCASGLIVSFVLAQYMGRETQMKQAD
jgi:hypothetical protein